jgi:hypothetical protein
VPRGLVRIAGSHATGTFVILGPRTSLCSRCTIAFRKRNALGRVLERLHACVGGSTLVAEPIDTCVPVAKGLVVGSAVATQVTRLRNSYSKPSPPITCAPPRSHKVPRNLGRVFDHADRRPRTSAPAVHRSHYSRPPAAPKDSRTSAGRNLCAPPGCRFRSRDSTPIREDRRNARTSTSSRRPLMTWSDHG